MKTTTTRFEEQERRTKRPNKRIFFFLLSHCTFIKRFIIFQAFSDSLRPICATQKHRQVQACTDMQYTHTRTHTKCSNEHFVLFLRVTRPTFMNMFCIYAPYTYISRALISEWITALISEHHASPPLHIPHTAPMCIYELRKELKLLFWRVLLRSSSHVSDVFSFVTDMSHYLAL